jgi:hypothetical protein
MRRRREEHDAAHRRRHQRGKRAHERKKGRFATTFPREEFDTECVELGPTRDAGGSPAVGAERSGR